MRVDIFKVIILVSLILTVSTSQGQELKISFKLKGVNSTVDSIVAYNLRSEERVRLVHTDTLYLSLERILGREKIKLINGTPYPNPSSGSLYIPTTYFDKGFYTIELYELSSGRRVFSREITIIKYNEKIKLSGLSTGAYLLRLVRGHQTIEFRVFVSGNSSENIRITLEKSDEDNSDEERNSSPSLYRIAGNKVMTIQNGDTLSFKSFDELGVRDTLVSNVSRDVDLIFEYFTLPEIEKPGLNDVSTNYASLSSKIIENGGLELEELGVVWSMTPEPTFEESSFKNFDRPDSILSVRIENLKPGTEYYLKGYAKNAKGEFYSKEINFRTSESIELPQIGNPSVENIGNYSASVSADILDDGNSSVIGGVCYSTEENPSLDDEVIYVSEDVGMFSVVIKDLVKNTTYYVKSFAQNEKGITYSDDIAFKTANASSPTFSLVQALNITESSAEVYSEIADTGGSPIIEVGVCWGQSFDPSNCEEYISYNNEGNYTKKINGLAQDNMYFIRSYAINEAGETGYSPNNVFFTTPAQNAPILATSDITEYFSNSVEIGSTIISEGSSNVESAGFCYSSTNNSPTLGDQVVELFDGSLDLAGIIAPLNQNLNYYIRSFAINATDTAYGPSIDFRLERPTVSISASPIVASQSAKIFSEVVAIGSSNITERGIAWSHHINPDTTDFKLINPTTGSASYETLITDLKLDSTYYVRAFAINSVGISYTENISFNPDRCPSTFVDIEGNNYSAIQIGDQCWSAENIRVTQFYDGTEITLIDNQMNWDTLGMEDQALAFYDFDDTNSETFGAFYTWSTISRKSGLEINPVHSQGVCPTGWHIPMAEEWNQLEDFITNDGHAGVEGNALKSSNGWESGGNGFDEYGFNSSPSGFLYPTVGFQNTAGKWSVYWLTDSNNLPTLNYNQTGVLISSALRAGGGVTVRCIKD